MVMVVVGATGIHLQKFLKDSEDITINKKVRRTLISITVSPTHGRDGPLETTPKGLNIHAERPGKTQEIPIF